MDPLRASWHRRARWSRRTRTTRPRTTTSLRGIPTNGTSRPTFASSSPGGSTSPNASASPSSSMTHASSAVPGPPPRPSSPSTAPSAPGGEEIQAAAVEAGATKFTQRPIGRSGRFHSRWKLGETDRIQTHPCPSADRRGSRRGFVFVGARCRSYGPRIRASPMYSGGSSSMLSLSRAARISALSVTNSSISSRPPQGHASTSLS
jgi:hypothetical protein